MTLQEANTQLEQLLTSTEIAITNVQPLETKYYVKWYECLKLAGGSNMAKQEAEAKTMMQLEPIYEQYHNAKLELKVLLNKKEILMEICKNLRTMYIANSA